MKTHRDMSEVQNCVCFNLRRVARTFTQYFDAELRRQGIRSTQTPILQALNQRDSWSMAELSEWLGMDRTTLVRNLRPLQREGLLDTGNLGRGRHAKLTITARGREQVEQFTPVWRATQNQIVKTLGTDRWNAILNDLESAATALRK